MAGKVVKQLAGSGTGQSFMDRMNAAKHSLSGSGLGKAVCKATTEEIAAPKRKHLEYLIQCTNEPNVSIPELADHLISRCHSGSWVTSFKALVTVHNLMNLGNERFSQYLASNNCQLDLPNFTDKTTVQAYDMSLFIRHYSKYVSEKAESYRMMAFDFCKVKRGKDDGVLRTMATEKLLKALPVLQKQLDTLLEFQASNSDLNNQVINAGFILLYKDLIRLFASYNEGMINLIEKYFNMNKKQCKDGLALYKNFIHRMDKVNTFLKTAETMGVGDKESLGLQPVPSSVLDALEQHLASLEGRKYVKQTDDQQQQQQQSSPSKGITNSPSSNSGGGGGSGFVADFRSGNTPVTELDTDTVVLEASKISDTERQQIIEEETKRLADFAARSNAAAQRSTSPNFDDANNLLNTPSSPSMASSTVRIQQKPIVSKVISSSSMASDQLSTTTTSSITTTQLQHHHHQPPPRPVSPSPQIGSHLARDQFGAHHSSSPSQQQQQQTVIKTVETKKPSDDLLLLGFDEDPTPTMGNSSGWPTAAESHSNFAPTAASKQMNGFDPFQSIMQPAAPQMMQPMGGNMSPSIMMQPAYRPVGGATLSSGGGGGATLSGGVSPATTKKPFSSGSNLDETLASLAGSLSLGGGNSGGGGGNKWSQNSGTTAKAPSPMAANNKPMGGGVNWGNSGSGSPMSQNARLHTYNPFVSPLMYQPTTSMSVVYPVNQSAAWPVVNTTNQAWAQPSSYSTHPAFPISANNPFATTTTTPFQSSSYLMASGKNPTSGSENTTNDPFGALL